MCDFVHLHNHSHYSLQDAACTIDSLIKATQKNNMHAIRMRIDRGWSVDDAFDIPIKDGKYFKKYK